ncbi:mRNA capping enzyme, catalytic domain-containing protein [Mycena haematopus]|nr:mRNA capping enzyme, catalytic domain-containing protein [Mycena haematopus]
MPRLPDIPGTRVPTRSEQESWLQNHVASLCQIDHRRFPGSQPVSFTRADLVKLETQDFWVCEKSDGVRVLLLVHTDINTRTQTVYLIDRKNDYYELNGLFFPHHKNPQLPVQDTIVDGELVYDIDPRTKHETMRLLAFECLVVDGDNMMMQPLDKRYEKLKEYFYTPFARMKSSPTGSSYSRLTGVHIRVKQIQDSYAADRVFAEMTSLQHGSDGLIYTCVNAPYTPSTDENILKWKPPSANTIDFKLVPRLPPRPDNLSQQDFHAKPAFLLHVWCGDTTYEQYGQMYVEDDEWEKMKSSLSGEQYDDRIVEVRWEPAHSRWRWVRFRSDKLNGNHKIIVDKILISIADSVEKDILLERSDSIRTAWKARAVAPPPTSNNHAHPPVRGGPLGAES